MTTPKELAVTHRSRSARPVAALVWVCVAGILAYLLMIGELNAALRVAPWLILLSLFVYASQWRPCLRISGSGFEVVNGLRDHRIPFGIVEDIEVRHTRPIQAAGRRYVSWGAPTPPTALVPGYRNAMNVESRAFTMLPSNERIIYQPETNTGRDNIVAAWQKAKAAGLTSEGDVVVSTWNAFVITIGVLGLLSVMAASFV